MKVMLRRTISKLRLQSLTPEVFDNVKSIAGTDSSQSPTPDDALPDTALSATDSSDCSAGLEVPQPSVVIPAASKRKVSVEEEDMDELYYHMYNVSLQPRKKLARRTRSLSSTSNGSNRTSSPSPERSSTSDHPIHTRSSSPEQPAAEHATFRYLDLPLELQRIVLKYAFEPDKTARFPSYDYLVPFKTSQESDTIMRGHRIRLTIHFDLPRLFVSRQFLKDAVDVLGKLTFPKPQTVSGSRAICGGGAPTLQHSPGRFIHPRRSFEASVLQKTLTNLLAVSRMLNYQQQSAYMQKEILDVLVPRMPLLRKIEAFVPHELVWYRTFVGRYPPPGVLSWLSLDTAGLDREWRQLRIAVLSKSELQDLENGRCLPEDLCNAFLEDPDLKRCNAEAASFKKDIQEKRAVTSAPDGNLATTPGSLDTALLFNVSALVYERPNLCKIVTISVKFDGQDYSVTDMQDWK